MLVMDSMHVHALAHIISGLVMTLQKAALTTVCHFLQPHLPHPAIPPHSRHAPRLLSQESCARRTNTMGGGHMQWLLFPSRARPGHKQCAWVHHDATCVLTTGMGMLKQLTALLPRSVPFTYIGTVPSG